MTLYTFNVSIQYNNINCIQKWIQFLLIPTLLMVCVGVNMMYWSVQSFIIARLNVTILFYHSSRCISNSKSCINSNAVVKISVCFQLLMCACSCPAVKEKLTADPDSEIATTSLRVSLLCPVSILFVRSLCQTRTHAHTHARMHAHTHRYTQTQTDRHTHTHTHTHTIIMHMLHVIYTC